MKPKLYKQYGEWFAIMCISKEPLFGIMTKGGTKEEAYDLIRIRAWNEFRISLPNRKLKPHEPGYGIQQLY